MSTLLTRPPDWEETDDTVMSNCDGAIDIAVADQLMAGGCWSRYPGWNFCGEVWWTGTEWACEVWVYKVPRETITSDTLAGLMHAVSDRYGWQ